MQTIELPYPIGEKVYVLTNCSLASRVSETVDCGAKGTAKLEYCPFLGDKCPYGISSMKDCTKDLTWQREVFEVEVLGYEYSSRGLKVVLKEFFGKYDMDEIFSTSEKARAVLEAESGGF